MSGGVCARHCRLLFMKHVLPRLPRPARPWERPGDCGRSGGEEGRQGNGGSPPNPGQQMASETLHHSAHHLLHPGGSSPLTPHPRPMQARGRTTAPAARWGCTLQSAGCSGAGGSPAAAALVPAAAAWGWVACLAERPAPAGARQRRLWRSPRPAWVAWGPAAAPGGRPAWPQAASCAATAPAGEGRVEVKQEIKHLPHLPPPSAPHSPTPGPDQAQRPEKNDSACPAQVSSSTELTFAPAFCPA